MKTRHLAGVKLITLAALVTVFGTVFASAQAGAPLAPKNQKPTITTLGNRTLLRSTFEISNSNISTTCSTSGCQTTQAVFLKNVKCPVAGGKTCTLYVHVDSQVEVTNNDNGLFRFLVDGVAPNPGPTDGSGFVRWLLNDPDSGSIEFEARSFAVLAKVSNSVSNQIHTVEADIACEDLTGDGCTASMGFATLQIGEYAP